MCLQSLQNRLAMGTVAVKIAVAPIVAGVSPTELTSALRGVINRTKAQLGKVSTRAPTGAGSTPTDLAHACRQ